jgi:alkanesulfonate monooxygenase SsuD/methylene tetrahydromethanopterin reductase-like flavin-dependent oxidoreductase (luciferase family)
MWEEALSIIPKMWATQTFQHEGKYFNIPQRNVIPKPVQKPHPAIWMAGTQPESFEIAGSRGIGILALTIMVPVEELERRLALYRAAVANARPFGAFVNDRANCLTLVHCARTTRQAIQNGAPQAIAWYLKTVASLLTPPAEGSDQAIISGVDFAQQAAQTRQAATPLQETQATKAITEFHEGKIGVDDLYEALDSDDMIVVGDPEKCRQKLQRYADMGLNSVMCQVQIGDIPHKAVMDSIRLLGTKVRPHFDPA